jgi:hypothetical protein
MQIHTLRWDAATGWAGNPPREFSPALVLYFGSTDTVCRPAPFQWLRERFPTATIAGCSAGSQILRTDVEDDAVVAVALRFERTSVRAAVESVCNSDRSKDVGVRLARRLIADDLTAVLVLSDGLLVNGSELVNGLFSVLGEAIPLSGGLAGDGARFEKTVVGVDCVPAPALVAAIGLYGSSVRVSQAAVGGWNAFGPRRQITYSEGNKLYTLDNRPALDLYQRYLGDEAAGLPGTALLYPLCIHNPARSNESIVRTVLAVDRHAKTMTFAGDLPQGWVAQLMRGRHDLLVDGAASAARNALQALVGRFEGDKLALMISCVGRRLLMGQRTVEEIQAVVESLDRTTVQAGFYSYGEIAPGASLSRCELHNQTMAVTIIAESCS